jgi:outer membrane protein OmpA-like peptidoglycan-associated protein
MKTACFIYVILLNWTFAQDSKTENILTVYFKSGSAIISNSDLQIIKNFQSSIASGDTLYLIGYADGKGETESNLVLSQKRIDAVKKVGINTILIEKSLGESSCLTDVPDNKFRKVELLIVNSKNNQKVKNFDKMIQVENSKSVEREDLQFKHKFDLRMIPIRLEVLFYLNETRMLKSSYDDIGVLLMYLNNHPDVVCDLVGHICCNNDVNPCRCHKTDFMRKWN